VIDPGHDFIELGIFVGGVGGGGKPGFGPTPDFTGFWFDEFTGWLSEWVSYFALVFLFDVGKEGRVTQVCFTTGASVGSWYFFVFLRTL
jgi:hypothetical protein